jgi:tetratricopeptide (TPR) repeat protein
MNSLAASSQMSSITGGDHLSPSERNRLGILLEQYFVGLEAGLPPSVEELTRDDPELAEDLARCVSGLLALHRMAAELDPKALAEVQAETAFEPESKLQTIRRLGDFDLHEELGRGGMGVVYRATQRSLHRTVAIKLLPFVSAMNAGQIRRFQNEAEYAASLNHPNIVPVFAFGLEDGVHYYAMQWIDGPSLDQWMRSPERFAPAASGMQETDWKTVVAWGIQAAEGLHAAHDAGVVHRDVKPSNLLIDRAGKLWLSDFGLARVPNDLSLTRTGDIIGTAKYMSPEQAVGNSGLVDARSDVFSLGVTLRELLTLSPQPDSRDDKRADLHRGLSVHTKRFPRFQELPRDLRTVIAKATSERPEHRYDSARLFSEDLQRVLRGDRTLARPPSPLDQISRWCAKHRKLVAAATLLGIALTIGSMLMAMVILAQKRDADVNRERAKQSASHARNAVDRLGAQVAELLADIPSAIFVRKQLLEETLSYYENFVASSGDDPTLRQDLASTHDKIGSLLLEIGNIPKAIRAFEAADAILAELESKDPNNPSIWFKRSVCENNLGRALQLDGQTQRAASLFIQGLERQKRILSESEIDVRLALATTENNLGLLLAEIDSAQEATKYFQQAIERLEAIEPTGTRMAFAQTNLANALIARSPEQAARHAERSVRILSKQLESQPNHIKFSIDKSRSLGILGTSLIRQEKFSDAIVAFEEAVELVRRLATLSPSDETLQQELAIEYSQLGLAYASAGQMQRASATLQQAVELQNSLVRSSPRNHKARDVLAGMMNRIGMLDRTLGNRESAQRAFQESILIQKTAIEIEPSIHQYRERLRHYEDQLDTL